MDRPEDGDAPINEEVKTKGSHGSKGKQYAGNNKPVEINGKLRSTRQSEMGASNRNQRGNKATHAIKIQIRVMGEKTVV